MKKKLILLSFIITAILNAKPLSFDDSLNSYLSNNLNIKNLSLNKEIRVENEKELSNSVNLDLGLTGKTTYTADKLGIESKVSYKDYYISAKNTDISKNDSTLSIGYEKSLNEYLYNNQKASIDKLKLENENSLNSDKSQLNNYIKSFSTKYLDLLNVENTIKAKQVLLEQKQKEYEIALIKEKANTLSSYEVRVIKLSIEKLQAEISLSQKEKEYKKEEFKKITSIKDDFSLTDVEEINKFEIYIDESGIKELENSILIAKEELKSLKVNNLPQLTAGLAYELVNSDISASLSFSWNPLDYKGNEKVKELSIEKLANELDEKKTEIELTKIQSINTFSQNEINLELSKKDVEIAKAELEKYETMKKLGTVSEYDYFNKQKDLLDKELEYINLKNQLNLNKKLEVVYGSL